MMPQFKLKRSRMRAVRTDCSGNGSKEMALLRSRRRLSGLGEREGETGDGGIGFGSFHLCDRRIHQRRGGHTVSNSI